MRTRHQIADDMAVLKAQAGDGVAFEGLVRRWQKPLWLSARRTAGRDDLAWDALQETWLAILRGLHRLADPEHFAGWAHCIARRKGVDSVRAAQRRRRALMHVPQHEAEIAEAAADTEGLARAIRSLSPKHREVIALHYRDGFAIAEIAALIEVPPGTVKSRLHHARQLLKEIMA